MKWNSVHMKSGVPNLVLFYKEQCPMCETLRSEWIQLAEDTLKNNVGVNVAAVMRDDNLDIIRSYHLEQYPTVRLYRSDGKYKEMKYSDDGHDLHEKNILDFIR